MLNYQVSWVVLFFLPKLLTIFLGIIKNGHLLIFWGLEKYLIQPLYSTNKKTEAQRRKGLIRSLGLFIGTRTRPFSLDFSVWCLVFPPQVYIKLFSFFSCMGFQKFRGNIVYRGQVSLPHTRQNSDLYSAHLLFYWLLYCITFRTPMWQ